MSEPKKKPNSAKPVKTIRHSTTRCQLGSSFSNWYRLKRQWLVLFQTPIDTCPLVSAAWW